MFDTPFDFIPIAIAVVAFIVARKALDQIAVLRKRLEAIEAAQMAVARPVPPPLPPTQAFEQASPDQASPDIVPAPPPIVPDVESIAPAAATPGETAQETAGGPAAP